MLEGDPGWDRAVTGNGDTLTSRGSRTEGGEEMAGGAVLAPPDGGYGWVIVISSFMIFFVYGGSFVCFAIYLGEFSDYFQMPQADIALIGAIEVALFFAMSLPCAVLRDQFGSRILCLVGLSLLTVGYVASAFATSFVSMFLCFGLIRGVGAGMLFVPANVIVQQYFLKKRALAGGIASCGLSSGTLILGPVHRLLINYYGWRGGLIIMAAITAQMIVFASLFRPPPVIMQRKRPDEDSEEVGEKSAVSENKHSGDPVRRNVESSGTVDNKTMLSEKEIITNVSCDDISLHSTFMVESIGGDIRVTAIDKSQESINDNVSDSDSSCCKKFLLGTKQMLRNMCMFPLLKDWHFLLFAVGKGINTFGYNVMYKFATTRAIFYGTPKMQAAFLVSVIGLCSTVARFISGAVGSTGKVNLGYMYGGGILVGAVIQMLSIIARDTFPLHILFCLLFGLTLGAPEALHASIAVDYFGIKNLSRCLGWMAIFYGIASMISLPVAGLLFDRTHDYTATFILSGLVQLCGGLCCLTVAIVITRQRKKEKKAQALAEAEAAGSSAKG